MLPRCDVVVLSCCCWLPACNQRVVVGYESDAGLAGDTASTDSASETGAATSAGGSGTSSVNTASSTLTSGSTGPLDLPSRGAELWRADFESGDASQWSAGDQGGSYVDNDASYRVAGDHVHAGNYALEATVVSIGNQLPQAMMLREFELSEGYYSAYFCVPERYDTSFLVMMKFMGDAPFQGSSTPDRFDIDLSRDADDGQLYLQLDEHGGQAQLSSLPVPVGSWFQIEAFYRSTPDADGRLVVWQDGVLVFDTKERPTAPSSFVVFGAGVAAWRVNPLPASVFIDDARVSAVE